MDQQLTYFLGIIAAYASACFIWLGIYRVNPVWWPVEVIEKPASRFKDLWIALLACVGVMAIGQLYSAGLLIPESSNRYWSATSWILNNLIIFSPLFLALKLRKQSLNTVFFSTSKIGLKLGFGAVTSVIGICVFYLFHRQEGGFSQVFEQMFLLENIRNFPAVFLEGIAIAFLFVRLSWSLGKKWAVSIPAILFAIAHIPRSIASGEGPLEILVYSIVTATITVLVLHTSHKSRDIIWLGVIHYMMDIAIGAFN